MLATRIRQKDGIFYFVSFKAKDILNRVRFTSRFYFEGETIEATVEEMMARPDRAEWELVVPHGQRRKRHHDQMDDTLQRDGNWFPEDGE